jgi:hypothetical protein
VGVFVDVFDAAPGLGADDVHAEFFDELALQGVEDLLALLHFPAREFPVARIGLAFGPLAQQHVAVGAHQDADRDVDRLLHCFTHYLLSWGSWPA